jgi:class 3 adenylate cyclase/tetratricopeptide (TPR) repeat protein
MRLADRFEPEVVRRIMWSYYEAVSRVCERHGGTVEKFIGDAVMAVFGVPVAQEDHALRGVRAAGELREAIAELNERLARDWNLRLAVRTGVNSGEVVAGDPAGGQALVTGDAVNVAARLEQAAAAGEVLIGDETRKLVAGAVELEPLGRLELRGKDEPVKVWRMLEVHSRAGQLARRLDTPMLGRGRELGMLVETFERAARDRIPQLVTMFGPAGIGKSRLALELRAAVQDRANVLTGSCLPYGEGITYWPLTEIVRELGGDDPRGAVSAVVASDPHAELIAERIAQAAGLTKEGGDSRDLAWATRRFFECLARSRPLVLVFEDIHWAEAPLLDLIEHVAAHSAEVPLVILCLAREELLERRRDWPRDRPRAAAIQLAPLPEEDVRALIDRLVAAEGVMEEGTRAALVERSGGNPLFVEQMLAMLREEGGAGDRISVPPTIQALLAARLDRLTLPELEAIGAAAVVGTEFWPEAVTALLDDSEPAEVDGLLTRLVRKELIAPEGSGLAGGRGFAFRHALIRDAAYESLTKEMRADLHEDLATWVERSQPQRVGELEAILGYHLEQAYRYRTELAPPDERARALAERAAVKLASAGRRAARARQDGTAVSLLNRAVALMPADDPERLELLPLIGIALEGIAKHPQAGEIYAEALDRARVSVHPRIEGLSRLGRAHVWFVAEPEVGAEEIVAEVERAIALLEQARDEPGLVDAWRLVGEARVYEGRAREGQTALERALEHLGAESSPRELNSVSFAMGMCLLDGPAPLDRAVEFARERLEMARVRGLPSMEADMLHLLGVGEGRRARFEEARRALADATAISEELGLSYMAAWSERSLGRMELAAGDSRAAERALRRSYDVLSDMGLNSTLGEAAIPLADALYRQGRHEDADRLLETVREEWASGDVSIEAPRLAVRAKLFAARGWDQHASRIALRALRLVRRTDWACLRADVLLAYAEVLRLSGKDDDAVPILREALGVAEGKGYAAAARAALRLLEEPGERVAGPLG